MFGVCCIGLVREVLGIFFILFFVFFIVGDIIFGVFKVLVL